MLYHSTRSLTRPVDSAEAVLEGLAPDGGLYMPESLPEFDWRDCLKGSSMDMSAKILSALLPDIPDMPELVTKAYTGKFETDDLEEDGHDHAAPAPQPQELKPFGFLAVCAGDGLAAVFADLGADGIVNGGQTMNPSTESILTEVEGSRRRRSLCCRTTRTSSWPRSSARA